MANPPGNTIRKRVMGQPQTALALLEKGEELTAATLADATGGTVQGARQALAGLYSKGEVHRRAGGRNGQFIFYLNGKTSTNGDSNGKTPAKPKQAKRRTPEPPASSSMSLMWSDGDKMLFDLDGETWFARKV